MGKKLKAGKPYTYLVGVPTDSSDPSKGPEGNPRKARTSVTLQHVSGNNGVGATTLLGRIQGTAAEATCSITVDGNVEALAGDTIYLGDYEINEGTDWELGVSVNATATALASAIDNLKGFSAEVNGVTLNQVDITGPKGPSQVKLELTTRSGNLSLDPDGGYMTKGGPSLKGPSITK